jgi:F-type H+-transporting ATPase subunit a
MTDQILPSLPMETPYGFFNYEIVFWTVIVCLAVALLGWWLGRRLQKQPGRRQVAAESVVGFFDGLCRDILGPNRGRKYLPLFGSLFLFICISNIIGLFPMRIVAGKGVEIGGEAYVDQNGDGVWEPGEPVKDETGQADWTRAGRKNGVFIPSPVEPTRNVNVTIGISIFLAVGMYAAAMRLKGLKGFPGNLFEPFWWMFPLNLIGMVAEVVSVSFRLFGNIFGGAIIIVVIGGLTYNSILPADMIMNLFLVLFVGVIQAFVFTMLWMTYHSNLIAEEEG